MRAVYVTGAVILIVSLCTSWWLYKRNAELIADRDNALIGTYQDARDADAAALQSMAQGRKDAETLAQERRDALKNVTAADTVADVLRRCRDGLRTLSTDNRSDTTKRIDGAMQGPGSANRDDAR